jgi:hypothetical protein
MYEVVHMGKLETRKMWHGLSKIQGVAGEHDE